MAGLLLGSASEAPASSRHLHAFGVALQMASPISAAIGAFCPVGEGEGARPAPPARFGEPRSPLAPRPRAPPGVDRAGPEFRKDDRWCSRTPVSRFLAHASASKTLVLELAPRHPARRNAGLPKMPQRSVTTVQHDLPPGAGSCTVRTSRSGRSCPAPLGRHAVDLAVRGNESCRPGMANENAESQRAARRPGSPASRGMSGLMARTPCKRKAPGRTDIGETVGKVDHHDQGQQREDEGQRSGANAVTKNSAPLINGSADQREPDRVPRPPEGDPDRDLDGQFPATAARN